jgi:ADP-heptose:LPS heptosyltransferase
MIKKKPYKTFFRISSLLTDFSPRMGAWLLNTMITGLLGNQFLIKIGQQKNIYRLKQLKEFRRILVIGDLNIGDAINLQASISALRDFFPDAEIDYMINRAAANLIEGNPEISTLWPIFTNRPFPKENDVRSIKRIIAKHRYNVIFNFCPFFKEYRLFPKGQKVINYAALVAILVRNEKDLTDKNHVVHQAHQFIHDLFSDFMTPIRQEPFKGVTLTLSDSAIEQARNFLKSNNLFKGDPLIFYNPDTSSPFTRVPFELQVSLIKRLAQLPYRILLGAGHTAKNIGLSLLSPLSLPQRKKITIIPPSTPLDCYVALIDFSDLCITGDTGLLHIAGAHKVARSKNYNFRNKTAIFSIFGATPARIYGYDSELSDFFPANQEAPSHVYISESPCRNITCINKMAKTCKTVRCFQFLDTEKIVSDIHSYLSIGKNGSPVSIEKDNHVRKTILLGRRER